MRFIRQWAMALCGLGLAACGGGGSGVGVPVEAIVAPSGVWTWIPIEGSRCASGSSTGIGLRIKPGSRELMLFMDGGGKCTTGANCWGSERSAANVEGYGAAEFENEDKIAAYALFDTSSGTANPFANMNMAMVPYCTGDAHTGRVMRTLANGGTSVPTYFNGALNMELALARLAATFPSLEAVWLVGTSAGGGGASYQQINVRNAFNTTVHSVIDSAPGLDDGDEAANWAVWGVAQPCTTCTTVAATREYNRSLNTTERFAFLSFRFDATTANGRDEATFDRDLQALVEEYQSWPATHTLIADNVATGFGPPALHVVTTQQSPAALKTAYLDFLDAMVRGVGWDNVVVEP